VTNWQRRLRVRVRLSWRRGGAGPAVKPRHARRGRPALSAEEDIARTLHARAARQWLDAERVLQKAQGIYRDEKQLYADVARQLKLPRNSRGHIAQVLREHLKHERNEVLDELARQTRDPREMDRDVEGSQPDALYKLLRSRRPR